MTCIPTWTRRSRHRPASFLRTRRNSRKSPNLPETSGGSETGVRVPCPSTSAARARSEPSADNQSDDDVGKPVTQYTSFLLNLRPTQRIELDYVCGVPPADRARATSLALPGTLRLRRPTRVLAAYFAGAQTFSCLLFAFGAFHFPDLPTLCWPSLTSGDHFQTTF